MDLIFRASNAAREEDGAAIVMPPVVAAAAGTLLVLFVCAAEMKAGEALLLLFPRRAAAAGGTSGDFKKDVDVEVSFGLLDDSKLVSLFISPSLRFLAADIGLLTIEKSSADCCCW